MDSSVKALTLTSTTQTALGRVRIKGAWVSAGAGVSFTEIRSGSGSGLMVLRIDSSVGSQDASVVIPGQGILVESSPHVTISGTTAITLFYEG
jgi:hypothetical protein